MAFFSGFGGGGGFPFGGQGGGEDGYGKFFIQAITHILQIHCNLSFFNV